MLPSTLEYYEQIVNIPCSSDLNHDSVRRVAGLIKELDVAPVVDEIELSINKAISNEFRIVARNTVNPFGGGYTAIRIVQEIKRVLFDCSVDLIKSFYTC